MHVVVCADATLAWHAQEDQAFDIYLQHRATVAWYVERQGLLGCSSCSQWHDNPPSSCAALSTVRNSRTKQFHLCCSNDSHISIILMKPLLGKQNGAGAPAAVAEKAEKEEAQEWIKNWRSKKA